VDTVSVVYECVDGGGVGSQQGTEIALYALGTKLLFMQQLSIIFGYCLLCCDHSWVGLHFVPVR